MQENNADPLRRPRLGRPHRFGIGPGDLHPLISKGFQHQFWQAVKKGADQAAKDYKVKVTFEGPETEQQSTSRSTCCLPRWPRSRVRSARRTRQQGRRAAAEEGPAAKIPVIAFDSASTAPSR